MMEYSRYCLSNNRPLGSITFEEIRWQYGVFRCDSTGAGRDKRYFPWHGVKTKLGEIEEKEWYSLAETLIKYKREESLLNHLIQWGKRHDFLNSSPSEIHREALQLHAARIFDNPEWVGFISFNQEYRPQVLESANLVLVCMDCCSESGFITQEQINRATNGTVPCPHCGRWSKYTVLERPLKSGVLNASFEQDCDGAYPTSKIGKEQNVNVDSPWEADDENSESAE